VLGRRHRPADRLQEPPPGRIGIDVGAVAALLQLGRDAPRLALAGEVEEGLDHGLLAEVQAGVEQPLEDLVVGYLELADGLWLVLRLRRAPTSSAFTAASSATGTAPTAARPVTAALAGCPGRRLRRRWRVSPAATAAAATAAPAAPPRGAAGRPAAGRPLIGRRRLFLAQNL